MESKLYTLRDVANLLGCRPHRITYLLMTRQVPEPERLSGRRLFTEKDVSRLADALSVSIQRGEERGIDGTL